MSNLLQNICIDWSNPLKWITDSFFAASLTVRSRLLKIFSFFHFASKSITSWPSKFHWSIWTTGLWCLRVLANWKFGRTMKLKICDLRNDEEKKNTITHEKSKRKKPTKTCFFPTVKRENKLFEVSTEKSDTFWLRDSNWLQSEENHNPAHINIHTGVQRNG